MAAPSADADLIIAGAGCAGLSALWYALRGQAPSRRIIVIDREVGGRDERTWSFWGTATTPFAELSDRRWDRVGVRFPGWQSIQELPGSRTHPSTQRRTYMRVRERDFQRTILDEAARHRSVRFVAQDITGIRDDRDVGVVELPEGELRAPIVMQSAQLSPADRAARVRHPLRQHFGGWEVRTEKPVFDPTVVTLMDFDTDQHDGTSFFYVLPTSRNRALVEHTMFSTAVRPHAFHDEQIRARLDSLGAGCVEVERREYGVIPMEDRVLGQRWGAHVWNLGGVGGMTKPSTGYTFQRIQLQARHLIDSWAAGGTPSPLPNPPRRYRMADRTLLNILHHRSGQGRPIFERLFRTTPIDQVLTFLDERSTLTQDAAMMARLPWPPFLRAAAGELAAGVAETIRSRRP